MKDGKAKQNKTKYKSKCKIKHGLCLARENGMKWMHERRAWKKWVAWGKANSNFSFSSVL